MRAEPRPKVIPYLGMDLGDNIVAEAVSRRIILSFYRNIP